LWSLDYGVLLLWVGEVIKVWGVFMGGLLMRLLFALRSGFGFFSTIPVGISMEGIVCFMRHSYLFPVVGFVLGLLIGVFSWLVGILDLSPFLRAVFVLVFIYGLTGLNHLDGLADFGDGVTAHGSREKKVGAMKDTRIGVGGIYYVVVGLLVLFSLILASWPFAFVVAEMGAKDAMLVVACFGRSLHRGLGSVTVEGVSFFNLVLGLVVSFFLASLARGVWAVLAVFGGVLAGFFVLLVANRNFGGVSGDVLGAANEFGRIWSLFFAVLFGVLWTLW